MLLAAAGPALAADWELHQLTDDADNDIEPCWSPDGTWVAYTHAVPDPYYYQLTYLWKMETDGATSSTPVSAANVSWQRSAFRPIYRNGPLGGLFYLANGGTYLCWWDPANNGGVFGDTYVASSYWTYYDRSGNPKHMWAGPQASSPDGTRIAYSRTLGWDPGTSYVRLATYEVGSGLTNMAILWEGLVSHWVGGESAAWSPDGSKIALCLWPDGEDSYQIYLAPPDGSSPASRVADVPGHARDVVWSPDGTRFAFTVQEADESRHIAVMNVDGTGFQKLTDDDSFADCSPDWSPDGNSIVFHSNRSGNWDIWSLYKPPYILVPGGLGSEKAEFKAGSVAHLSFTLTGADGLPVSDASASGFIAPRLADGSWGTEIPADGKDGNLFELLGQQYTLKVDTAGMAEGVYRLRILLDGRSYYMEITLT